MGCNKIINYAHNPEKIRKSEIKIPEYWRIYLMQSIGRWSSCRLGVREAVRILYVHSWPGLVCDLKWKRLQAYVSVSYFTHRRRQLKILSMTEYESLLSLQRNCIVCFHTSLHRQCQPTVAGRHIRDTVRIVARSRWTCIYNVCVNTKIGLAGCDHKATPI